MEKNAVKAAANIKKQHLKHEAKLAKKAENICKAEEAKAEAAEQKRLRSVALGSRVSHLANRVPIANRLGLPVAHLSADAESEHTFALGSTLAQQVLLPRQAIGPTPCHPLSSVCNLSSTSSSTSNGHDDKRHHY